MRERETDILPSRDFGEDTAFFLYLVPIVAAIAYGIYQWLSTAKSSTMPAAAYLIVSKSPYLFILSLSAVLAAIVVEVNFASLTERNSIIQENTSRLQILAVIVLVISFAAAVNSSGYDLATAFSLFLNGRYAIIFAFFLIGISFLLTPKQYLGNAKLSSLPDIVGLILVVLAPMAFYGGIKIHVPFALSAISGIVIGIVGLALLLSGPRFIGRKPEPRPVEAPQIASP